MGILSFLYPLSQIAGFAERAHQRVLEAQNDKDKLEAENERDYWRGRVEAAQAAAMHDKWWSPRNLMGWCAAILVCKLLVWDTTFGLGVTQNPGEIVLWILVTIIGFFFVSRSAETIAGTIASVIGRK